MAILPKIRQRVRDRVRLGKNHQLFTPQDLAQAGGVPTNQQGVLDEDDDNPQF